MQFSSNYDTRHDASSHQPHMAYRALHDTFTLAYSLWLVILFGVLLFRALVGTSGLYYYFYIHIVLVVLRNFWVLLFLGVP